LVWTSNTGRRENNVQSARIKERQRREEHVLDFLAAQHGSVYRYVSHVAKINWRYSQLKICLSWLGRECTFQLHQLAYLWKWIRSNLLNNSSQAFIRKFYCSFPKLGSVLILLEFKLNCCLFEKSKDSENTTCIMQNQLYKLWYQIPSHKMSVTECTSFFMWWLVLYEGIWCDNIYSWFCRIHVLYSLHSYKTH